MRQLCWHLPLVSETAEDFSDHFEDRNGAGGAWGPFVVIHMRLFAFFFGLELISSKNSRNNPSTSPRRALGGVNKEYSALETL